MAEPGGLDLSWLPPWAQTAAGVGITAAAFILAMRGRWGNATLTEPAKSRADVVVETQSVEHMEILKSIRDAGIDTRDAVRSMSATMVASRANQERIVTAQEKIAEIMKAQDDKTKRDLELENEALRLLTKMKEKEDQEREDRERAEHRRSPRRE